MFRSFTLPALAVCVAGLISSSAFAQTAAPAPTKVAVINFQKALLDTAELKKDNLDLQNTFKPRQDALNKVATELQDLQQQLQASQGKLSAAGEADLQARAQRKQTEAQRLQQDLQDDANAARESILKTSGQRMAEIVKKLAEEKGYDLVVDTQNTYFFKPAIEITAEATAAYDKAFPLKK
jgi:outer membrane protein